MKRARNIAAATAVLLVVVFLFAQHQNGFPEAYRFRQPSAESESHSSSSLPEPVLPVVNEGLPSPETIFPAEDNAPDFPQSSDLLPPAESNSEISLPTPKNDAPLLAEPTKDAPNPPLFEPEFPFQDELDLDLPIDILQSFSTYPPQNYNPNSPKYAYATFMATRSPSLKDPYYLAIHSLIHRLLWSPRSRSTSHPFIVYVASFVTPTQRALLSGAGALVRDLAPLDWNPSVPGIQHRWKDLFAKLNMWNDTEFERIAFLDADAFPVQNIDAMFDVAPAQPCVADRLTLDDVLSDGSSVCEDYVFAGVPQDPFNATHPNINVGSMVFSPSKRMHERLLRNYGKTDRYDCLMAEQAFLNWQFEASGAFPASVLEREWGGFFPGEGEEGRLRVVHEKIWMEGGWLGREWEVGWKEMVGFYGSEGFAGARRGGGG